MAAMAGLPAAQLMMGESYFYGHGNQVNYANAFQWFHKAAAQGEARAELYLGFFYRDGKGTEPSTCVSTVSSVCRTMEVTSTMSSFNVLRCGLWR